MKLKGRTDVTLKKSGAPVKVDLDSAKDIQMLLKDIGAKPYKSKDKVIL